MFPEQRRAARKGRLPTEETDWQPGLGVGTFDEHGEKLVAAQRVDHLEEGEFVRPDGDGFDAEPPPVLLPPLRQPGSGFIQGDDGQGEAFGGEDQPAQFPIPKVRGDDNGSLAAFAGRDEVFVAAPFFEQGADFCGAFAGGAEVIREHPQEVGEVAAAEAVEFLPAETGDGRKVRAQGFARFGVEGMAAAAQRARERLAHASRQSPGEAARGLEGREAVPRACHSCPLKTYAGRMKNSVAKSDHATPSAQTIPRPLSEGLCASPSDPNPATAVSPAISTGLRMVASACSRASWRRMPSRM